MKRVRVKEIERLRREVSGEILLPGDDAYEDARKIWNAMIDKRPGAIVRCSSTSDVVHAVNFARENGTALAIRGGGHNIA
ncbi:MAG TPA: FAD-binding protein, partial [Candidatus Saccharimonadales bacterium]|nr:FAD-binding protein [Candidatus Saccharimonadales bacterium]